MCFRKSISSASTTLLSQSLIWQPGLILLKWYCKGSLMTWWHHSNCSFLLRLLIFSSCCVLAFDSSLRSIPIYSYGVFLILISTPRILASSCLLKWTASFSGPWSFHALPSFLAFVFNFILMRQHDFFLSKVIVLCIL